jgi:opacity protein-like surface antigen
MMNKFNHLAIAATAVVAMLGSNPVLASDDNHFAGGYVVLTQEWKKAEATVDGEKIKKSEAAPSIGFGYTFALDKHSTMGIKATIDTKNGEYGVGDTALGETEVKEKSHYSLAVEPGYAINDDLLLFGILAYHSAKADLVAGTATSSSNLSGFGYGAGFKYALPHHLFLMGELQKIDYRGKLIGGYDVKPSSTVLALGIGYHF